MAQHAQRLVVFVQEDDEHALLRLVAGELIGQGGSFTFVINGGLIPGQGSDLGVFDELSQDSLADADALHHAARNGAGVLKVTAADGQLTIGNDRCGFLGLGKGRSGEGRLKLRRLLGNLLGLFLGLLDRRRDVLFWNARRIVRTAGIGLGCWSRGGGRRCGSRRSCGDTRAQLCDLALEIRDDRVYRRRRSRSSSGRRSDSRLGLGLGWALIRSCWALNAARSLRSGGCLNATLRGLRVAIGRSLGSARRAASTKVGRIGVALNTKLLELACPIFKGGGIGQVNTGLGFRQKLRGATAFKLRRLRHGLRGDAGGRRQLGHRRQLGDARGAGRRRRQLRHGRQLRDARDGGRRGDRQTIRSDLSLGLAYAQAAGDKIKDRSGAGDRRGALGRCSWHGLLRRHGGRHVAGDRVRIAGGVRDHLRISRKSIARKTAFGLERRSAAKEIRDRRRSTGRKPRLAGRNRAKRHLLRDARGAAHRRKKRRGLRFSSLGSLGNYLSDASCYRLISCRSRSCSSCDSSSASCFSSALRFSLRGSLLLHPGLGVCVRTTGTS